MMISPLETDQKTRTFVFSFDDKYTKFFSVVLISLIEHKEKDCLYEIIVLHDSLSALTIKRLMSLIPDDFILRFFDVGSYFYELFGDLSYKLESEKWVISTFYDLLVPVIMPEYKRVLYCDSDMIFRHEPRELFETPFDGNELIAVRDSLSIFCARLLPGDKFLQQQADYVRGSLKISDFKQYFNSGVLLFNIPSINKEAYLEKVHQALSLPVLPMADQDVLNYVFLGKTLFAPQKFNLQAQMMDMVWNGNVPFGEEGILEAARVPVVIHYASYYGKPWNNPDCYYGEKYWEIAKFSPYYRQIFRDAIKDLRDKEKLSISKYLLACFSSRVLPARYRERFQNVKEKHRRLFRMYTVLLFGDSRSKKKKAT